MRGIPSSPLDNIQSDDVERRMLSSTMDCTRRQTMLAMAMVSYPLGTKHIRTSSGVKYHHCLLESSHDRMTSTWHALITFGLHTSTEMSGVVCYHRPWIAYTIEIHRVWHAIIALVMNTRSDDVRHVMPSSQLFNIHTTKLRQAWQAFVALRKHTQSRTMYGI